MVPVISISLQKQVRHEGEGGAPLRGERGDAAAEGQGGGAAQERKRGGAGEDSLRPERSRPGGRRRGERGDGGCSCGASAQVHNFYPQTPILNISLCHAHIQYKYIYTGRYIFS